MTKHPQNKAERRLIEAKKKRKKGKPTMRDISLSSANHLAAVENFLHSLHLIDADEKVAGFGFKGDAYTVTLEKEAQEEVIN